MCVSKSIFSGASPQTEWSCISVLRVSCISVLRVSGGHALVCLVCHVLVYYGYLFYIFLRIFLLYFGSVVFVVCFSFHCYISNYFSIS